MENCKAIMDSEEEDEEELKLILQNRKDKANSDSQNDDGQ